MRSGDSSKQSIFQYSQGLQMSISSMQNIGIVKIDALFDEIIK